MALQLPLKWTQHLPERHEQEKFKELLVADEVILGRLYAIIEEYEKSLDTNDGSLEEYLNPAWPYLKADRIGERRGLNKIKQLISFIKE